jgi:hypothetical protein
MTWLVIVVGWRFYFPPFAVRLRRMGHPGGVADDGKCGFLCLAAEWKCKKACGIDVQVPV